ncbi:MAG: FAS1-like dehydratase domain-containing protein [Anaerolineales bacterium]
MTEEIQSKITDAHRALIGQKGDPTKVVVKEVDAHRMRDILEDTDPRFADETRLAPAYVISSFGGRPRSMPGILPGGLLTQQEWKFTRPFRVGEELSAVNQIIDIRDRLGGRYGYSVLVTSATDFYDTEGNHVAASMVTITQFDPASVRRGDNE